MKCERCNVNDATHHFKKSINGVVTEKYLCASCAAEENVPFKIFGGGQSIFPSFISPAFLSGGNGGKQQADIRCGVCGTSLQEFNETAFVGCPKCYEELRHQLEPVIKKLHGGTQHTGKIPKLSGGAAPDNRAIERTRLVRLLENAINGEEFEEAARIRDMIRVIDNDRGGK